MTVAATYVGAALGPEVDFLPFNNSARPCIACCAQYAMTYPTVASDGSCCECCRKMQRYAAVQSELDTIVFIDIQSYINVGRSTVRVSMTFRFETFMI